MLASYLRPTVLVGLAGAATAQQFAAPELIAQASGNSWRDLATPDINGDGLPELAYRARVATGVYHVILHWNQNGEFQPGTVVMEDSVITYIVSGDVDNDGDEDVIAGGSDIWLLRNNAGTLAAPIQFNAPQSIAGHLTDLDLDGDLDLLLEDGNCYPCLVSAEVLLNDGAGGFVLQPQVNIGNVQSGVAVGDIDGDGDPDLLERRTPIAWLENVGLGAGAWTRHSFGSGGDYTAVGLADIDLDGDLDAVARRAEHLDVFLNQPAGTFGTRINVATAGASSAFGAFDIGDYNSDGLLDVAAARVDSSSGAAIRDIVWFANLGAGTFSAEHVAVADTLSTNAIKSPDLDGDSHADLIVRRAFENTFYSATNYQIGIGLGYVCPSVANSTGNIARLTPTGSTTLFLNNLRLNAADLPPEEFVLFVASRDPGVTTTVPNSQGVLCVSGNVGRFDAPGRIMESSLMGTLSLQVDLGAVPTPAGTVAALPGDTWYFQAWHRDQNPQNTSNFTDAVSVSFR